MYMKHILILQKLEKVHVENRAKIATRHHLYLSILLENSTYPHILLRSSEYINAHRVRETTQKLER